MNDQANIILAIEGHFCMGHLDLGGSRILDVINSPATGFLSLRDAELHRIGDNQCVSSASDVLIRKDQIILAMVAGDAHEAPEKRRNSRTNKQSCSVLLTAGGFSIFGHAHYRGTFQARDFLSENPNNLFNPITDAQLTLAYATKERVRTSTVFVNGRFVSLLTVVNERDTAFHSPPHDEDPRRTTKSASMPAVDPLDVIFDQIRERILTEMNSV